MTTANRTDRWTGVTAMGLALLALAAVAGCGDSDAASDTTRTPARVMLIATELASGRYEIKAPRSVKSGAVEVTLRNHSSKPRDAQLIRITDGHTVEEAVEAIAGAINGARVPPWLRWAGGAGETMPGKTTTFTVDLRAGRYYAVDTTSDEGDDAKLRAALGAVAPLQVVRSERPAKLPSAAASITANVYGFDAKNLAPGSSTVEFHNAGTEQHHFVLAPILKGRTFADVKKFATTDGDTGPPPVSFADQVITGVLDGGQKQLMRLDLKSGRYALFCLVSDRAGGPPHVAKGMLDELKISHP